MHPKSQTLKEHFISLCLHRLGSILLPKSLQAPAHLLASYEHKKYLFDRPSCDLVAIWCETVSRDIGKRVDIDLCPDARTFPPRKDHPQDKCLKRKGATSLLHANRPRRSKDNLREIVRP